MLHNNTQYMIVSHNLSQYAKINLSRNLSSLIPSYNIWNIFILKLLFFLSFKLFSKYISVLNNISLYYIHDGGLNIKMILFQAQKWYTICFKISQWNIYINPTVGHDLNVYRNCKITKYHKIGTKQTDHDSGHDICHISHNIKNNEINYNEYLKF